jgi:hypothetical protein
MFRPAGHHQVLLRLGDCCTSFSLLVAFKILKFNIYLVCHLLRIVYFFVSRVLALLPLCVCPWRVARDTVQARRDCVIQEVRGRTNRLLSFDTTRTARRSTTILLQLRVFVAAVTFLLSRYLATIADTHRDTQTDERDL